jgi:acylphosphatase
MAEPRAERVRAHVRVSGRVQGVGFRFSLQDAAERAGVGGWARNLPDGRVEAVLQGDAEAVRRLVGWCREGPPGAWVEHLELSWEEPGEDVRGFSIERTPRRW